jgi:nucleoside-diphosphate-sugar epimerase
MGGMGFIEFNKAVVAHDNVLMDAHVLEAARQARVTRLFYASSACVYPPFRLERPDAPPLRVEDAYPADPVDGYGWEKLYAERLCRHYREDYGLETRVARFHSIYGPLGTYDGGREKAPAAICRKVALADDGGPVEVWGDGQQTRTYCYVDDCVEGVHRLMRSDHHAPINLGSDELITIDARAARRARGRQARHAAARAGGAAGGARPGCGPHARARGARLGAARLAGGRAASHLRVDRGGARRVHVPRDGAPRDGAPRDGAPRDGAPRARSGLTGRAGPWRSARS